MTTNCVCFVLFFLVAEKEKVKSYIALKIHIVLKLQFKS